MTVGEFIAELSKYPPDETLRFRYETCATRDKAIVSLHPGSNNGYLGPAVEIEVLDR